MTTTFAHLQKTAEDTNTTVSTFAGEALPAGHFGANTRVNGVKTVYLLEGEKDDPCALVKGHVVMAMEDGVLTAKGYKGDSENGKFNPFKIRQYFGEVESFTAFFKMVA